MIHSRETNMNYLSMQLTCKPDLSRMGKIMRELNHDVESERDQETYDLAVKIFNELIKPVNMEGSTVKEAVCWAYDNMDSALNLLSEKLGEPSAGERLKEIVHGYLWIQAMKEARERCAPG